MGAETTRSYRLAFAITCIVFPMWGVARCLYDTMVAQFTALFGIGVDQLIVIQSLYSCLYFVFAIPTVLYARVLGSKAALVFGLGSWACGAFLFFPAAHQHVFLFFAVAALVMYCGWCFVELSITPIIAGWGAPERTPLRLNMAHALFPLGMLATMYSLSWLKFSDLVLPSYSGLLQPYMVIGAAVLLLAFAIDNARFPTFATQRGKVHGAFKEFRTLLSRPAFLAAMATQTCCGALMAGLWTIFFWYVMAALPGTTPAAAFNLLTLSIVAFAVGRIAGAFLMLRISPALLLALFSAGGVVSACVAAFAGGQTGVYAMLAACFCMSLLFPTILGLAIRDLGPLTKSGTALMFIGGSPGGIGVGAVMLVWHVSTVSLAMLVPALLFAAVLVFALYQRKAAAAPQISPVLQMAE